MKWIRWWGFIVFLVIVGGITSVWMFLVDGIVKRQIEEQGTRAVGARVELDEADVTLFPAGLTLTRLQVTSPEEPMTNAIEIARVSMNLDAVQLLWRKVIVEEMAVTGVKFGTPRSSSGAITERVQPESREVQDAGPSFTLPPFEVPDMKTILAQEELETLKLVEAIKTDIEREKELWDQRLKDLPGKTQFAKYQDRIEQLKSSGKGGIGGILGGVEEVQSIKQDIERDVEQIKNARKEFDEKIALFKTRLAEVKAAPQKDLERLKDKYSLSPKGLANLGQTLLGKQIGGKLKEALQWYELAKPYLEGAGALTGAQAKAKDRSPARGEGVDIRFQDFHPLPDFLIRLAKVSLALDIGEITGAVQNITSDQPVLGTPLTFTFTGGKLQGLRSIALNGTVNHIDPANSSDSATLSAQGYQMQSLVLSDQPDWPVTLQAGLVDVNINAELRGQVIEADGTSDLSSLHLSAGRDGDTNPLTKALSGAVAGISQLSVKAEVTGTLQNYNVKIHSDLDRILQDAGGNMVKELAGSFGKELQAAIGAKVEGPLKSLTDSFGGLEAIGGVLGNRLAQEHDLLKNLLAGRGPQKSLPGGFKLPF